MKRTGSDHQIVGITASAVKLLAVNFSNIGNIGGVAFLYGGVRIVHGDSCLCHNGRLYVIIRYLLYFLFQCQLFVISKRYTLCRINFLIDNRNPVYITREAYSSEAVLSDDVLPALDASDAEEALVLLALDTELLLVVLFFHIRSHWLLPVS